MVRIIFYEKPGCINNNRQKRLLRQAGHTVVEKNLLAENWRAEPGRLREFFGDSPVETWFNRSAPAIKQGRVDPAKTGEAEAIALMLSDPLLIRRPLMEAAGEKMFGFDEQRVDEWIGLAGRKADADLEQCPKTLQPGCGDG